MTKQLLLSAFVASLLFGAAQASAATVGYWRFEEGVASQNPATTPGAILDSSGMGNNGTAALVDPPGMTYSSMVPGPVINPGALANTLSMGFVGGTGGSQEGIFVPDAASLDLDNAVTLEAFVNPASFGANNAIFGKWTAGGGTSYILRLNTSGGLTAFLSGGSNVSVSSTTTLSTDTWYHVAMTWTSSAVGGDDTMRLYINGVQDVTTNVFTGPINNSTSDLAIGRGIGSTSSNILFNGMIDEARISNVALQPSEFLTAVPEPSSVILGVLGLGGLLALRRRRR